ncbi:MAG: hypothetical protein WDW38_008556 [Sanguina aurantia]
MGAADFLEASCIRVPQLFE